MRICASERISGKSFKKNSASEVKEIPSSKYQSFRLFFYKEPKIEERETWIANAARCEKICRSSI